MMGLMAEHTADLWPEPASLEDLLEVIESAGKSDARRLVDEAVRTDFIVASEDGYFSNNGRLARRRSIIRCPSCGESFSVKQWWRWGVGNDDVFFLYCDSDSSLVLFDAETLPRELKGLSPFSLDDDSKRSIEENLKPCPCGGRFRFDTPLLCPKCESAISKGYPRAVYYFVISECLRAEKDNIWK
jgi:hypothetical protein